MKKIIIFTFLIALFSCEKYESNAPTLNEIEINPTTQYTDLPIEIKLNNTGYCSEYINYYCDINNDGNWDFIRKDCDNTPIFFKASNSTSSITIMGYNSSGLTKTEKFTINISSTSDSKFGFFTDQRDNQTYRTVKIGDQIWLANNLNYQTSNSWVYDNNQNNADLYGRLYTWQSAIAACPVGWHLPTDEEWKQLERYLGMSESEIEEDDYGNRRGTTEGDKLKVGGTSGLNILFGGIYSRNQYFSWDEEAFVDMNQYGVYWTNTSGNYGSWAFCRIISQEYSGITRIGIAQSEGAYVRCIKD